MSVLSSDLVMQIYELTQTQIPIIKNVSKVHRKKIINESKIKSRRRLQRGLQEVLIRQRLAQD